MPVRLLTRSAHAEEDMYAALWESDRIMKIEREERECAAAIQRNKDCLSVRFLISLVSGCMLEIWPADSSAQYNI